MYKNFLKVVLISVLLITNLMVNACSSTEEEEESEMAMNNSYNSEEGEEVVQPQNTSLNNTPNSNDVGGNENVTMNNIDVGFNSEFTNVSDNASTSSNNSSSENTGTNAQNTNIMTANTAIPENLSSQMDSDLDTTTATSENAAVSTDSSSFLSSADVAESTSMPINQSSNTSNFFDPKRGVVKYVVSSTPVYAQPGSTVVGQLEQGDHPLVWQEGQFAKTSSGVYIPLSSLSDQGIGRIRETRVWESQAH